MKISTIKKFGAIAVAGALLCSLIFVLAACGSGGDSGTQSESNPSSTVSIYYKDDVSSEIYDDIISDGSEKSDGNLASDAKPELSVPTGKPSHTSSVAETSSKPSSSAQQGAASSETPPASSSSQSSSTSSYDKGYTKPY